MRRRAFVFLASGCILLLGFLVGISITFATAGTFFAGVDYTAQSNAVSGYIPFTNPSTPSSIGTLGFSAEWVMTNSGTGNYVQVGWLKYPSDTSGPQYFFEYHGGCGSYCRFRYGTINSSDHNYKVQVVTSGTFLNWCGFIDNVQKNCGSSSTIGFSTAPKATWSGETTNTDAILGGTSASPVRIYTLTRLNTNGTWTQVNTNSLGNITTPGTNYHATSGWDTTSYVKNWTEIICC